MLNFSDYPGVPNHSREALSRYIEEGIPVGDFLKCVLCNDLMGSVGLADRWNYAALKDITGWVWTYAPAECWGNEAKYLRWLKEHPARQKVRKS